jgi:hypothetical protein
MKYTLPGIVGHDLNAHTTCVACYRCFHRDGSGRKVVFVDTPGFDFGTEVNIDILAAISSWLTAT